MISETEMKDTQSYRRHKWQWEMLDTTTIQGLKYTARGIQQGQANKEGSFDKKEKDTLKEVMLAKMATKVTAGAIFISLEA